MIKLDNNTVITIPLKKHMVEMVTPRKCLLGYYNFIHSNLSAPFDKYCKPCEYIVKDNCKYKIYITELATGNYIEDDRDYHYIQFCCAGCGELIELRDKISYIYHDLVTKVQYCKRCKTPHRCLDYENNIGTFAVPVTVKQV